MTGAVASVVGVFITGWVMGGKSREKSIKLKGLVDINSHYEKMADNFKAVDTTIDHALGLLRDGKPNRKVPPTVRAGSSKKH